MCQNKTKGHNTGMTKNMESNRTMINKIAKDSNPKESFNQIFAWQHKKV